TSPQQKSTGRSNMPRLNRRRFLQSSAALGSVLGSAALGSLLASSNVRAGRAAPARIDVPIVDQVVVHEITDNQHNIFLKPSRRPGLVVQRTGFPAVSQGKTLESEWGLALYIESTKAGDS